MSQNQPSQFPFDKIRPWLPWMIFVFAFAVRLVGIGWGLPNSLHNQSYHPDEQVIFSYSQAENPGSLQFTPGNYSYGTLYLTALNVVGKMISTYGGEPKQNDIQSYWKFIGTVDLVGRILTALAGAGVAVVLFLMLRRFTRTLGALAGALFIAVAPAFVVHSRFQTVDVPATFFLALSLYNATKLISASSAFKDRDNWSARTLMYGSLAGMFAGLSAGTKYTGILALLGLFVACAFSASPQRWKAALLGVGAALLAFLVSTPGVLLDSAKFMHDFRFEMLHTSTGHDLLFVDVASGFIYHLLNLFVGVSPLLLLLGIGGIVEALIRKRRWMWILIAFSLVYYVLIGRAEVLFLRYTFPLYIVLAAGFGSLMGGAHERQGRWKLLVGTGILALGWAASKAGQMTTYMATQDPRDQVALELKGLTRDKPQSAVGIVSDPWYYTPPLIPDSAIFRGPAARAFQRQEMLQSHDPKLEQYIPQDGASYDWDTRLITEMKPDYIVYSSFEAYDPDRLQDATNLSSIDLLKVNRYKAFQQALKGAYNPFVTTNDGETIAIPDLEYIHPWLIVWKRKDLR